ncbi:MAG: cytochrome b/b6 domain-containing protein [Betaproteobacteria bacterium]|nr:cytochrome b/b6 domain-containing protein [Betaproteobacteria bacterium]MDE2124713.1 cytochrome b/b6 domain-containing protein [Betaproteobacteria bacterium]MDE2186978.1 cytochrome b/b6 domain-containing protein [Betaproteobacteria bacterium]MDE2325902.1 cytochrome b/b6 domain-containing protein [Betaproteobacteria bacterium]
MSSNTTTIHPVWLRVSHWINALAVVLMVMSGWRIYDASPIFSFSIPTGWTLGGWLGGALQWHFAAMWLLFTNGLFYLFMNLVSGRFKRKYFPLRPRDVWHDFRRAITGRLGHADLAHYNAVQKFAYLVVVLDLIVLVLSGLVIWKSVQFPLLRALMGGYDNARIVHFVAMSIVVAFFVVHLVMVALVPKSFLTMVRGR